MRQFHCSCEQPVFFDNKRCYRCDTQLGFDPQSMSMLALNAAGDGLWRAANGKLFRLCDNGVTYGVCNWLIPQNSSHPLCCGCRFNRTVPNQSQTANQQRWQRLEEGKKRLLYTLLQLQLPLENGWDAPERGLLIDFIEDARSHSAFSETYVNTGYLSGVITINTLEADDAAREAQRLQMKENYRTVLGHLRHESGHYFWHRLNPDNATRDSFTAVYGDEKSDYQEALDRYYASGPAPDWQTRHISAYASAHPTEDWAESWGHYLHIYDALDTAAAHGLTPSGPDTMSMPERISVWSKLSITLNELNRSVGKRDAYPFLFNQVVVQKLGFVEGIIRQLQTLH